jgi:hypothetical protein
MAQVGGLHKWLQLKQYQLELTYSQTATREEWIAP